MSSQCDLHTNVRNNICICLVAMTYCWWFRNPAPVDMVSNSRLFTRFHTYPVVVWDFFHQRNRSWASHLPRTACDEEIWWGFFCKIFGGCFLVFGRFMTKKKQIQKNNYTYYIYIYIIYIPSRKLTYPTWGKGKSSSNMPYQWDMLIPWRVYIWLTHLKVMRC